MQSSTLHKTYSPLLIGVVILSALGITIGIMQAGVIPKPNDIPKSTNTIKQAQNIAKASTGKQDSSLTNYSRRPMSSFGNKVGSLNEAMARIVHKPKLPDQAVASNPAEVYSIDTLPPDDKGIGMQYANGVQMWIYPNKKDVPDYDFLVKTSPDLKIISVNGIKGMAGEPGKQTLISGDEIAVPGVVCWYENGTEYQIYGDNVNVNKLMAIARSMK